MIKGILASFLITLTFLGCAAPSVNPAVGIDHPANPEAPEAPLPPPSQTLTTTSPAEPATATEESMPGMQMNHDMGDKNRAHHHH